MGNLPRLYPIIDLAFLPTTRDLIIFVEHLAAAGCTLIQYRNKSSNAQVMLEQARELKRWVGSGSHTSQKKRDPSMNSGQATGQPHELKSDRSVPNTIKNVQSGWGAAIGVGDQSPRTIDAQYTPIKMGHPCTIRLIMNDRADLALLAEFDGVHVGQDDLSPESVRGIIGPERWLGVSTHNPEQLQEADRTSADYLAIGPVFSTTSKDQPDPVVGLEGVRRARQLTRKPLVAIGGITRANAAAVIEAGADSVAVISDLLLDPRKSAEEFFRILR